MSRTFKLLERFSARGGEGVIPQIVDLNKFSCCDNTVVAANRDFIIPHVAGGGP